VFAAEMLPVIVSLQHSDQHLGKVPRRASARLKNSVELARLRRELDKVVAAENYEQAARLRDQIKSLPPAEDAS
jgi:protein arginine kinase activator